MYVKEIFWFIGANRKVHKIFDKPIKVINRQEMKNPCSECNKQSEYLVIKPFKDNTKLNVCRNCKSAWTILFDFKEEWLEEPLKKGLGLRKD